jgi:hypothetical protein
MDCQSSTPNFSELAIFGKINPIPDLRWTRRAQMAVGQSSNDVELTNVLVLDGSSVLPYMTPPPPGLGAPLCQVTVFLG